jgi:hypothetical protein
LEPFLIDIANLPDKAPPVTCGRSKTGSENEIDAEFVRTGTKENIEEAKQ